MRRSTRFVICGFGNVGKQIARLVSQDSTGRLEIVAIAARDKEKARHEAAEYCLEVPIISASEAPDHADIIVESSTYAGFRDVVEPSIRAGAHVVAVSVGALANNMDLLDLADEFGATLQIANGTLPGLDLVRAARESEIEEVRLVSSVLPHSLIQEAYVKENGIDLVKANSESVLILDGSAREAALHFPRHFNVAVSLSLAGIGLDRTNVKIMADGRLAGAVHTIHVKSSAVTLEMTSRNLPSPENNRTSRIVAPSIIAALRELSSPLRVGS